MEELACEQLKATYLTAEELKLAASLLYQAYHDDPLFEKIFRVERADYEQKLRAAIREELTNFWQSKQSIIGIQDQGNLIAVACLVAPDALSNADRVWHWRLKMLLTAGHFSTKQFIEKEQRIKEAMKGRKAHMLAFIAVQPLHQSRGVGHYLMNAIEGLVDEDSTSEGIGVYVTLDRYLSFFEHEGFELLENIAINQVDGKLLFRARQE